MEGLDGLLDETLRVLLVFENDPVVGDSLDRGSTVFDEAPRSAIVSNQFGVCTKPTLSGDEARDMGWLGGFARSLWQIAWTTSQRRTSALLRGLPR